MAAISGWGGRVVVAAAAPVILPVSRWSVTDTVEAVDTTNSHTGDVRDYTAGYRDFDVSFDCFWDTSLRIMADPAYVVAGAFLEVALFLDKNADGKLYFFNNVLVLSVQTDDEARGVVKYTVTGKQSGTWGNFISDYSQSGSCWIRRPDSDRYFTPPHTVYYKP